jgi:RNA polymerase sigma-70 factor (ECF subfamily)
MAWLAVVTRNRAIDRLRRRRAHLSLDDAHQQSLGDSLASAVPGPEDILSRFQSGSAVQRALRTLTPQRQQVLGLAFFQGLSHQEIADALGLPLGTVKSHVRRGLATLQGELRAVN